MHKLLLIIVLLLANFNSFAASPVWKIEGHGHTIYLAGTIHLLRLSDYPLPKGFDTAYQKSSTLVFETDLQALKSPLQTQKLIASLQLAQNDHLLHYLTPKTQQRLKQYCIKNKIELEQLTSFKASFVALTLTLTELSKKGVSQTGVDEFYNSKALKDKKQIIGLETADQQIQFLSQMGEGFEDELIQQTLNDLKEISQLFNKMIVTWKKGDLKQLETFFITPMQESLPIMYQQLLVQRNQAWLPHLKKLLTTPETEMVLVGSAHLAGQEGLLNMLKNSGYRMTQLN